MTPLHFAPLQGYTEAPYRDAHASVFGGIDTYYTPFVRIERGEFRRKDTRDIEPENNHVAHLVPQLIASDVEKAKTILALFIEKGYREVSINLGCPFPILAKRHNGSGMLPYPEEVKALLAIVEQHPEIRFSVKMRLGWENPEECLALAPLLNDVPLEHIALHARLGKQQYKGEVDLDAFAAFADICQKPLIYNGDLLTVEDIQQIEKRFPQLAGIMIGRGLLANPALAMEYKTGVSLSPEELREKLRTLHAAVYARYEEQLQGGDEQLLHKIKPFWDYLEPALDRKVWKAIHKSGSLNKYQAAVRLV
ncbi:MAG: tRNA-dihydrouridine synthase family protein [Bacteroides sp.]|uniref:tRNA-dihydrouridine synthase family protein n=1 Tax=Bacteroides sp. TaxID=29523 RepID=UPI002FC8B170